MCLNKQGCSPATSYTKIVFICLGKRGSRTTFNIAHIFPQQLALFSETSVTCGLMALCRTGTITNEVKQFSYHLTLPSTFLTSSSLSCFSSDTNPSVIWGSRSSAAPGVTPSLAEVHSHFRQAVLAHLILFFTSSLLSLLRKQIPSEFGFQCAYIGFNLVFAVLFALVRTVQRNELLLGLESHAANN